MPELPKVPPIAVVTRPAEDTERVLAAMIVIEKALGQIRDEELRVVLDAVMSIYLNLSISCVGIEKTDSFLRFQRKNLPRIAALIRAHNSPPAGRA